MKLFWKNTRAEIPHINTIKFIEKKSFKKMTTSKFENSNLEKLTLF